MRVELGGHFVPSFLWHLAQDIYQSIVFSGKLAVLDGALGVILDLGWLGNAGRGLLLFISEAGGFGQSTRTVEQADSTARQITLRINFDILDYLFGHDSFIVTDGQSGSL